MKYLYNTQTELHWDIDGENETRLETNWGVKAKIARTTENYQEKCSKMVLNFVSI